MTLWRINDKSQSPSWSKLEQTWTNSCRMMVLLSKVFTLLEAHPGWLTRELAMERQLWGPRGSLFTRGPAPNLTYIQLLTLNSTLPCPGIEKLVWDRLRFLGKLKKRSPKCLRKLLKMKNWSLTWLSYKKLDLLKLRPKRRRNKNNCRKVSRKKLRERLRGKCSKLNRSKKGSNLIKREHGKTFRIKWSKKN